MTLLDNRNKARILGLSHKQPAPPLLSTFGGRSAVKPRMQKLKVPKAIDDPPQSTDEEDSQLDIKTPNSGAETPQSKDCAIKTLPATPSQKKRSVTASRRTKVDDSSSGDELATRVDIERTRFIEVKRDDASQWPTRRKRKESSAEPENETNLSGSKWQRRGDCVSETRRRGPSPTASTRSDEHFTNAGGFIKKKKKPKMTYKTRSQSSQEPVTKKDKDKKTSRKMKIRQEIIPPSPEKPKVKKLLKLPEDIRSSPSPKTSKKLLLVPAFEDIDEKSSIKLPESLTSSQGSSYSNRCKKSWIKSQPDRPSSHPRGYKSPSSSPRLDLRTVAKKEADRSSSPDFTETEGSATEDMDSLGRGRGQIAADVVKPAAICPWCGEEVDANLLAEFSKGNRLNVRLQTKFCQKHKHKTAEEVWKQKEYPRVEWDGLDGRFVLHRDWLLAIIHGRPSHFRTIHEKNIESGKARSMKKEGNMNPGYYGPRGFNIMCDYLVEEFGDLLKKRAIDDKVIAGRGSASFIQNVLVAELAVQMIREDMRVSEEKAIEILEDSKVLGELIHEEV